MRRWLPLFLVLPVLAVVAAGCGSGGALSLDPVASAATKTQQAGTYKFDFTADMQILGQHVSFGGSGQADEANQALQMTLDFKGLLPASMTQDGTNADMVIVNQTMYMQMPFLAGKLPGGKQWLKLDLSTLDKSAGGGFGSFKQVDPQQYLQQLLASSDTQKVGTDTVQGEQMTHYKTIVDISKLDSVPAAQRAKVRQALQQVGMDKIPVDVWVDDQGLLRRESLDLTFGKALQHATMSMTFDMHDFGTPVTIDAPPAGDTFDASGALQQGLGGLGSSSGTGAGAGAAQSEWATRANTICRAVYKRYAALGSYTPKTIAGQIKLARGVLPVETDELAQLSAISAPKSAAATQALALLRADLAEGRAAVAAAGNVPQFKRLFQRWYNDHRSSQALAAAGAADCG